MGTALLNGSLKICRLCGKEQQVPTVQLFGNSNDASLIEEIAFFLPIQVCKIFNTYRYKYLIAYTF